MSPQTDTRNGPTAEALEAEIAEVVEEVRTLGNPRYVAYLARKRWGYGHPVPEAAYAALEALPGRS